MPDTTPNQYLKNLDVHFISLVDAGANKKTLVHESAHHSREAGPEESGSATSFQKQVKISKTDDEKRLVYCIVYSPDEVDAHGDAMEAEEIEKAAHHFLFEGRVDQVDKQHDEEPDEGKIVESYIIGKSDANFPDDPAGSWGVVIKVLNDDTWAEVKKGEITGVSMQGVCNTEPAGGQEESEKSLFKKFMNRFSKMFPDTATQKDFKGRLMQRQIYQAVHAFEDEVRSVIRDDETEDPKAAVLGVIDEFRGYVNELETPSKSKKTDMSDNKKKSEETEETTGNEPTEIEKALAKALDEKLDPLQEKVEDMSKRLEDVEKAAPGSKLEKGQEASEEEEKKRTSKGLSILD